MRSLQDENRSLGAEQFGPDNCAMQQNSNLSASLKEKNSTGVSAYTREGQSHLVTIISTETERDSLSITFYCTRESVKWLKENTVTV